MNKQKMQKRIPMIIQDTDSGTVLSLVYANTESLRKMRRTGYVWRYSRQQGKVVRKGAISGNIQKVAGIAWDCDRDALLVRVRPQGPACHTGRFSCFGKGDEMDSILGELTAVIRQRRKQLKPNSYTSKIVRDRQAIAAKLREECEELIEAQGRRNIRWEAADLLYFMLVYLENRRMPWAEVLKELRKRRKKRKR